MLKEPILKTTLCSPSNYETFSKFKVLRKFSRISVILFRNFVFDNVRPNKHEITRMAIIIKDVSDE